MTPAQVISPSFMASRSKSALRKSGLSPYKAAMMNRAERRAYTRNRALPDRMRPKLKFGV